MQKLLEIYFPEGWEFFYGLLGIVILMNVVVLGTHWAVEKWAEKRSASGKAEEE